MADKAISSNRHIVDQLADTRDNIKAYQKKEDALKEQISAEMGDKDSLGGDEYIAMQQATERKGSIDFKLMEQDGIDVEKYRKPKNVTISLRLERRAIEV